MIIEPWIAGLATIVLGVIVFVGLAVITKRGQDDGDDN